jgi:hypothetical protein
MDLCDPADTPLELFTDRQTCLWPVSGEPPMNLIRQFNLEAHTEPAGKPADLGAVHGYEPPENAAPARLTVVVIAGARSLVGAPAEGRMVHLWPLLVHEFLGKGHRSG